MKVISDLSVVVVIHLYVFVKIYQMNTLYWVNCTSIEFAISKVKKKKGQLTKW